jgi:hypothetical protein
MRLRAYSTIESGVFKQQHLNANTIKLLIITCKYFDAIRTCENNKNANIREVTYEDVCGLNRLRIVFNGSFGSITEVSWLITCVLLKWYNYIRITNITCNSILVSKK